MAKELKKGEAAVSFRRNLMALKWKDKRDVFIMNSIHDEKMPTVHDKKSG
jgi:hypothetical protein